MECQEADRMVIRYIENKLSRDELKEYLEHIRTCPSCMEELETFFIVKNAMEELNKDEEESPLDMKNLLEEDIRRKEAVIRREKRGKKAYELGIVAVITVLLYILTNFKL